MTQETEEGVAQSLVLGKLENLDHQFQRRQDVLQGNPAMKQETQGVDQSLVLGNSVMTQETEEGVVQSLVNRSTSQKLVHDRPVPVREIVFVQHPGETNNSNLAIKDTVEAPHLNLIVLYWVKCRGN